MKPEWLPKAIRTCKSGSWLKCTPRIKEDSAWLELDNVYGRVFNPTPLPPYVLLSFTALQTTGKELNNNISQFDGGAPSKACSTVTWYHSRWVEKLLCASNVRADVSVRVDVCELAWLHSCVLECQGAILGWWRGYNLHQVRKGKTCVSRGS